MRGGVLGAALGVLLGLGPSCGPATFACTTDAQCLAAGADGMCQGSGFCSFPDDDCASGQRYGDHAGELANKCAPPATADTDAPDEGDGEGEGDADDDDDNNTDDDDDDDDNTDDDDDDADTGPMNETGGGSSADGGGVTESYVPCDSASCEGFCLGINDGEVCTLDCDLAAPDCPALAALPSGEYPLVCMNFFNEGVCGVPCSRDTDCPDETTCDETFAGGICLYDAPPD